MGLGEHRSTIHSSASTAISPLPLSDPATGGSGSEGQSAAASPRSTPSKSHPPATLKSRSVVPSASKTDRPGPSTRAVHAIPAKDPKCADLDGSQADVADEGLIPTAGSGLQPGFGRGSVDVEFEVDRSATQGRRRQVRGQKS